MPGQENSTSHVLIADDNPQILELLEAYLEPLPVMISTAADGQEALDVIERDHPELVLLDIMMPRRSGYEVCRTVKDDPRLRDIGVIMVTALNEPGDVERAKESGADNFITKPVNKMELIDLVRGMLNLRQIGRSGENP